MIKTTLRRKFLALIGLSLSYPAYAQSGFMMGMDNEKVLKYKVQEQTPGARDRYTLTLKTLNAPTTSIQILYFAGFDGQINPEQITVRGTISGAEFPIRARDLDKSARALTLQFKEAIPKGEVPEVTLNEVYNPSSDGVYQIRARVLSGGPFPAYQFMGDWFITIGQS